ncbi:hypothetical protein HPP92_007372 [Vanilla planifolia]|uniref:Uncharacterized protein n=1 Tax=Vanilla planifolia TaxID=51239 RepID=A0A835VA05_VANPL|nr:hypothetical protein HPP92_007372 [Vanilla planifolia]
MGCCSSKSKATQGPNTEAPLVSDDSKEHVTNYVDSEIKEAKAEIATTEKGEKKRETVAINISEKVEATAAKVSANEVLIPGTNDANEEETTSQTQKVVEEDKKEAERKEAFPA